MMEKMDVKTYTAQGVDNLKVVVEKILSDFSDKKVFALYGEMGAGKTTLIKEFCKVLNVSDNTSSPTYSLVNEYNTKTGEKVYHFDLYRLKSLKEALDVGCEEYFFSGNYCFIEWPQLVEDIVPWDTVKLSVVREGDFSVVTVM
jgi:tRNA threonylcarbamoyladenosine biosynthesis protein TsaE